MNADECANPECGAYIGGFRSAEDPRYCHDCGDLFPSFHPRSVDDPYRIDPDELREGLEVSAEQCDNCGCSEYTVDYRYKRAVAVCNSCATEWPITDQPGRLLVW